MPLTLKAEDMHVIKWWVDASYATHVDMKSQTGAYMTLGRGAIISMSSKQKLNTRSSTETEVVAVDDALGHIMWTRHFLQLQGFNVSDNFVYQDNEAAILLENNGRRSSTRRTKHMNVRYFFVRDKIQNNDITVEHCSTNEMIGDFFTKPLQGKQFYKFRKSIMNLDEEKGDYASKPLDFPNTKENMV